MHKKLKIIFYALFFYIHLSCIKIIYELKIYTMDLNYIKKQLPIGAETEIAKMANVSVPSVRKVLYQLKVKPEIELKVLDALAKYIKDYKEKKATALQELQAVASA